VLPTLLECGVEAPLVESEDHKKLCSHLLCHPTSLCLLPKSKIYGPARVISNFQKNYAKLCDTLVKHARSPSGSLRSFIFIGNCSQCSDVSPTGADAFQPLLVLPQLETLVFNMHLCELDDQTLIKWAGAWSNLKTFKMKTSIRDTITLSGIKTLFQLCRNLENLSLSFDASKLDLIPKIPSTTPSLPWPQGLGYLCFSGDSSYVGPVMAVLSWVFSPTCQMSSPVGGGWVVLTP